MTPTATQAFAHNLQAPAAMMTFAYVAPQTDAIAPRKAPAPAPAPGQN